MSKRGQSPNVPSSSVDRAKRGIVSRLWVLVITRGLVLLSDWEELEEARGRRLQGVPDKWSMEIKRKPIGHRRLSCTWSETLPTWPSALRVSAQRCLLLGLARG